MQITMMNDKLRCARNWVVRFNFSQFFDIAIVSYLVIVTYCLCKAHYFTYQPYLAPASSSRFHASSFHAPVEPGAFPARRAPRLVSKCMITMVRYLTFKLTANEICPGRKLVSWWSYGLQSCGNKCLFHCLTHANSRWLSPNFKWLTSCYDKDYYQSLWPI